MISWANDVERLVKRASVLIVASFIASTVFVGQVAQSAPQKASGQSTGKTEQASNTQNPLPKVIKFSATWCGPCKRFAPVFHRVEQAYAQKAEFQIFDIDTKVGNKLFSKYKFDGVPAIVILDREGHVSFRHTGTMDEASLTAEVEKVTH